MKKTNSILWTIALLICSFNCMAGSFEVPSEITEALNKGDASTLSSFFNNNIELVVENKNDIFSKQQASGIISDFFRKNKVSGFTILHKGEKEASSFIIGTLKTTDTSFRVYILTRKNENKNVIQQLRIEPSNE